MRSKVKTQLCLRLYQQLFASDVAVARPEQEEASSNLVIQPACFYRPYVMENQAAIGYLAYNEWRKQGCGVVVLIPVWEEKDDPEIAVFMSVRLTCGNYHCWSPSLAEQIDFRAGTLV